MAREKKDKHFIKKPIYPGGKTALRAFISEHLTYPEEALKQKVEGTVVLKYTINYKGAVTEAHVVSGLGYGCDEEAIRLTKKLKFDVPNQGRKVRVTFHKDIRIHFRLPRKKPAAQKQQMQLNYRITTTKSEGKQKKQPSSGGYNYTVTIKK